MTDSFVELTDTNLGHHLEKFPRDEMYDIPVLSKPTDILEMYRRLTAPKYREPELDRIKDFYGPRQDGYTPLVDKNERTRSPYCVGAEGETSGEGWRALVSQNKLEEVAVVEKFPVKDAQFQDGLIVGAKTLTEDASIILKRDWNFGKISEPNGCFFDTDGWSWIVSPPVIAMYYDENQKPHFFYDKRRIKRSGADVKATGFVWLIRPAVLDISIKTALKQHIGEHSP